MKAIITKQHQKGRISASISGKRIYHKPSYAGSYVDHHTDAASRLCKECSLHGIYYGGYTDEGMVFVLKDDEISFDV